MRPLHRLYDTVVCVAGGSSILVMLPWVLVLARRVWEPAQVREVEWVEWVKGGVGGGEKGAGDNRREDSG